MRVLCVDDEPNALEASERELKKIGEVSEVSSFLCPEEALEHLRSHGADVALLDIDMRTMDGLTLARRIRELSPGTRVDFLTGYSQYAVEAFRLHVAGYLLKPATKEDFEEEFACLGQPAAPAGQARLRVQCFGNFEVFMGGVPVKFERSRTKELFAYLIDRRGAAATTGELCAVLWEDRPDTASQRGQLRNLWADLTRSLRAAGAAQALVKSRNSFAVAVDALDCDYYSFLRSDPAAVNAYTGEYMAQYSWAEMSLGRLERQLAARRPE